MKKYLIPILLLLSMQSYGVEKKEITIQGNLIRSSTELYPSSGCFVDTYVCKAAATTCYTITVSVSGPDKNAPYLKEGDVSEGDEIIITTNEGVEHQGIFRGYSWTIDPEDPYLTRIHSIYYSND